jgi:hypothetical protein
VPIPPLSSSSFCAPSRLRSLRPENLNREQDVRFVDEETRAAREVERIRTAGVVGDKPRRDSRRYERRLGRAPLRFVLYTCRLRPSDYATRQLRSRSDGMRFAPFI